MTAPEREAMKISDLAKRIIRRIAILTAVLMAASVAYYRSADCLPFVAGAALGAATGIAKVLLLERTVDRALGMDKKAAANYTRLNHMLRLLLSAAALVAAALVPGISLWGAAAGILMFQAAIYMQRLSDGKRDMPSRGDEV